MLHIFKKQFARIQQPLTNNVPNGEFSDLRQRLHSIKLTLKYTLSMLQSTNRTWILQIQQQRQFSERFHEAYPSTDDDTYLVAKHFADESQSLYDHFTRDVYEPGHTPVYEHIQKQVRAYVTEIENVESLYAALRAAKSEAGRYQSKLDAMERSRKTVDGSRRQRNQQKLDAVRDEYRRHLKKTVEAQKKTYYKYPVLFKAALTAYWLSHEKHVKALVHSLEQTQAFARAYEDEMAQLDVANLSSEDLARLSAVDMSLLNNLEVDPPSMSDPIPKPPSENIADDTDARASLVTSPHEDAPENQDLTQFEKLEIEERQLMKKNIIEGNPAPSPASVGSHGVDIPPSEASWSPVSVPAESTTLPDKPNKFSNDGSSKDRPPPISPTSSAAH